MTEEQRHLIEELYPNHSSREISVKIGAHKSSVIRYAAQNGLKHTPETTERLRRKVRDSMIASRTKDVYKKIGEKRKRMILCERLRLLQGERQRTKLRISTLPQNVRNRIASLCHVFNYFRGDDLNERVVFYDSETKRNAKAEKFAMRKYHIRFENAEHDE